LAQVDEDQMVTWLKSAWEGVQKYVEAVALAVPSTVCLVGGGEGDQRFAAALQHAMGCAVQPLATETLARVQAGNPPPSAEFVATCGLAFQGAGTTRLSLNLVDHMRRGHRVARLRLGAQLVGLASVLVAVLWSVQAIVTSLRSREAVVEAYRKEEQSYQLLRPEVRMIRKHQAHVEERLKQLELLARTHDRMTRSFLSISETLPDSLWLTTLDLTKSLPHLTGALEGYAQSFQGVTQFIDRLKAEPDWVTVKPQATNVMTDPATRAEVVAFAIHVQRFLDAPSAKDASASEAAAEKTQETSKTPKKTQKTKTPRKK
jgi:Tfp pilus assembly protein PilN